MSPDYHSAALPLIIEPEALLPLLSSDQILLVAVCSEAVFSAQHIPGSVLIEPAELVCGSKPAPGKLPDSEQLKRVFSRIGLQADRHVIAYDDEGGGWAGRLIWTLDVLGHNRASYLNGGLVAWLQEGHPVTAAESDTAERGPTDYAVNIDRSVIASREEIVAQIEDKGSIVWDARSAEEFAGTRITAPKNGHIPGAVNLDWLDLMDHSRNLRLRPLDQIQTAMEALGISKDKSVITHCQTHHRSGLSYLVGKALGYDIKAYDGSWSEWGNHPDTPVET